MTTKTTKIKPIKESALLNLNDSDLPHIDNDLLELTKIEFLTIYYSVHFEYLYNEADQYSEYLEDLRTKENIISSAIDDLSELVKTEFPREIQELTLIKKAMWAIMGKISGNSIKINDSSVNYLIDIMLYNIMNVKIERPEYRLLKNEDDEFLNGLTKYRSSPNYVKNLKHIHENHIQQNIIPIINEFANNIFRTKLNKRKILDEALGLLRKTFNDERTASRTIVSNNSKSIIKFEAEYKKAIKVITNLKGKLETMSWDISTIYENLQSLVDDSDKVKEKETKALLLKYKDYLVMPVLDKNNSFLGGIEEAKSNFQATHMLYIDDEEITSGSLLNKAISKIEEVIE